MFNQEDLALLNKISDLDTLRQKWNDLKGFRGKRESINKFLIFLRAIDYH